METSQAFFEDDESLSSSAEEELALLSSVEERDEVKEIERERQSDTDRVRTWRFLVRSTMALTALGVSLLSFAFLETENTKDFDNAFDETVGAISIAMNRQQESLQHAFSSMATMMAAQGMSHNDVLSSWPFVTVPFFEAYAQNVRLESQVEQVLIANLVDEAQQLQYEEYVSARYESWVQDSHEAFPDDTTILSPTRYTAYFKQKTPDGNYIKDSPRPTYFSAWQSSPPPQDYGLINWNLGSDEALVPLLDSSMSRDETLYSKTFGGDDRVTFPHCHVARVIRQDIGNTESPPVAMILGELTWDRILNNLNVTGVRSTLRNNCDDKTFTYELNKSGVTFVGEGTLHEVRFTSMERQVDLFRATANFSEQGHGHCLYRMSIFPTPEFEERFQSDTPRIFACVVAGAFIGMALIFMIYDYLVQRRNEKLIESAAKSNAIVSSLFPGALRDRMMESQPVMSGGSPKNLVNFMMKGGDGEATNKKSKPMADIFLETSVLFADIVGFTAWSSTREPSQVFSLLETVFSSFDSIAKDLRIFKVETVGDCYVAACGLPQPRKDHAVAMARFSRRIMTKFSKLVTKLEVTLGPDTGDLGLRIGIHSGVVTAGVLRGERARFQLFGDTVNTAARIEATGQCNRIHLSQETADLIAKSGKENWLLKREDIVRAKGKGEMQTFWLNSSAAMTEGSVHSASSLDSYDVQCGTALRLERASRLIEWNVETFLRLLRQVVSRREAASVKLEKYQNDDETALKHLERPLDEVVEIIHLPEFDSVVAKRQRAPEEVEIDDDVVKEMRDMVSSIAALYRDNAFHNFEHASHVTMSVIKLLNRIVAPSDIEFNIDDDGHHGVAATLHDFTYGITSDPLTQFACAWSALVHDVDHLGVPNAQLIAEGAGVAAAYENRSVAEQNSLVISWMLLMDPKFAKLRSTICSTPEELRRFRELLVNGVMATDIADKKLKILRNGRWDKAFSANAAAKDAEDPRVATNRKATIVIEHLIQASDVAHTMQHWHVYRKWNEMLYRESYAAFKAGRAAADPALNWYKGEIGFFDFYIIPLAKKLKDCGVFGKSSDEYLDYALANRKEWESRGQEVVAEMIEKINKEQECR